jgi:hypothetical protein
VINLKTAKERIVVLGADPARPRRPGDRGRWREFITLLGGVAAARRLRGRSRRARSRRLTRTNCGHSARA